MAEEPENLEAETENEATQPEEAAEVETPDELEQEREDEPPAEAENEAESPVEEELEGEPVAEIESAEDQEKVAEEAEEPEGESTDEAEGVEPEDESTDEADSADEQGENSEDAPADEPVRIPNLKGLIGRKVGMTQIFDDTGAAIPVTIIEAGPCFITQIRTHAKDGYNAVQLGMVETSQKRLTGGQLGHLKRTNAPALRHLREFRVRNLGDLQEGEQVTVQVFEVGDRVDVVGTSKGRGFAGAIKRWGFHRGPKTHGQSDRERAPGSHGAGSTPGRTFKGVKGPGHMGSVRVSSQNLRIDLVDPERNLLGVRGSVPGPKGGLVMVKEGRKQ
jgi:large subunit ribosomal protein L3